MVTNSCRITIWSITVKLKCKWNLGYFKFTAHNISFSYLLLWGQEQEMLSHLNWNLEVGIWKFSLKICQWLETLIVASKDIKTKALIMLYKFTCVKVDSTDGEVPCLESVNQLHRVHFWRIFLLWTCDLKKNGKTGCHNTKISRWALEYLFVNNKKVTIYPHVCKRKKKKWDWWKQIMEF